MHSDQNESEKKGKNCREQHYHHHFPFYGCELLLFIAIQMEMHVEKSEKGNKMNGIGIYRNGKFGICFKAFVNIK